MTLTIELTPDVEARLKAAANQDGADLSEYAGRILQQHLPPISAEREKARLQTPMERAKAYRTWAESHPRSTPLLSEEAIGRESIYGERG